MKNLISKDFFYAGLYLGKIKKGVFFPSFPLLTMIGANAPNKVFVDEKAEWLFTCGRDLFRQGIITVKGSKEKGAYTLVFSRHGECLGFGKIIGNIKTEKDKHKVVIKNISDIGDFLRREEKQ
ncbi:MAG: hypothetical protein QXJ02_04580 [Candidatus Bathyarchaeia archaeon]